MARIAKIRPEQITRAQKTLQSLPEKDDRKSREEAAALLEKDFRKTMDKGYTPKEICAILKSEGIIIPAYLLKNLLAPAAVENSQKQAPTPTPETETQAPPSSPGQFTVTPDTAVEEL